MSTSLVEAKTGQELLVVCNPRSPDVSAADQSTVPLWPCSGASPWLSGSRMPSNGPWVEVDGGNGCPTSHHIVTAPRLIVPLRCHLGFGYLASSFPVPQSGVSLPAQTADPWKIKDTPCFGSYFLNEPGAAATVLPATSGGPLEGQVPPLLSPLHTGLCWNYNRHLFPSR